MTSPFEWTNYLELRPDKAGPIKLVRFLWSGYIEKGLDYHDAMIYCSKGEKENLKHRGIIYISHSPASNDTVMDCQTPEKLWFSV